MIHQYKLKTSYNIVLDVYSSSVHVVDDVAYDIIGMYEGHTKKKSQRRFWKNTQIIQK